MRDGMTGKLWTRRDHLGELEGCVGQRDGVWLAVLRASAGTVQTRFLVSISRGLDSSNLADTLRGQQAKPDNVPHCPRTRQSLGQSIPERRELGVAQDARSRRFSRRLPHPFNRVKIEVAFGGRPADHGAHVFEDAGSFHWFAARDDRGDDSVNVALMKIGQGNVPNEGHAILFQPPLDSAGTAQFRPNLLGQVFSRQIPHRGGSAVAWVLTGLDTCHGLQGSVRARARLRRGYRPKVSRERLVRGP